MFVDWLLVTRRHYGMLAQDTVTSVDFKRKRVSTRSTAYTVPNVFPISLSAVDPLEEPRRKYRSLRTAFLTVCLIRSVVRKWQQSYTRS